MGKDDNSCFGCLPWGRATSPTARPASARASGTRRPVSAAKKPPNSKTPAVKGPVAKAPRSSLKAAPEPAPLQWRSQKGTSDDNSSGDDDDDGGTGPTVVKPVGLGATAFPSDMDTVTPASRLSPTLETNGSPHPPRHLAPITPPRLSAGLAGPARESPSPRTTDAFEKEQLPRPPGGGAEGPTTGPFKAMDASTRLAELQQRFRAKSAAPTRPPAAATALLKAEERFRAESLECDSFSYNASNHGLGPRGPGFKAPLPPLLAGGGGGGCGPGLGPAPGGRVLPLRHAAGGPAGLQPRSDSVTAAIPGSLPSMTQPSSAGSAAALAAASALGAQLRDRDRDLHVRPPASAFAGSSSNSSPFLGTTGAMAPLAAARASSTVSGQPSSPLHPQESDYGAGTGKHTGSHGDEDRALSGHAVAAHVGLVAGPSSCPGGASRPAKSTSDEPGAFSFVAPQWQPGRKLPAGVATSVQQQHTGHNSSLAVTPAPGPTPGSLATLGATPGSRQLGKPLSGKMAFVEGPGDPSGRTSHSGVGWPELTGVGAAGASAPTDGARQEQDRLVGHSGTSGRAAAGGAAAPEEPLFASRPNRPGPSGSDDDDYDGGAEGGPSADSAGSSQHHRQQHLQQHPHQQQPGGANQSHALQSQTRRQLQQQMQHAAAAATAAVGPDQEDDEAEDVAREERPSPPVRRSVEKRMSGKGSGDGGGGAETGAGAAAPPPRPGGNGDLAWAGSYVGAAARPVTPAMQRMEAAMANEAMLASLLSGKGVLDFKSVKASAGGDGGGTAAELERFDRVTDAMSRLEDILAAPPLVPGRSLNARAGATENALTDFDGSAPAHVRPAIAVKPW